MSGDKKSVLSKMNNESIHRISQVLSSIVVYTSFMGVMLHGDTNKNIGNYTSFSFNIKQSHPKLLYQALSDLYKLRGTLYSFIGKVLIVCKNLDFMFQEDYLELLVINFLSLCNLFALLAIFDIKKQVFYLLVRLMRPVSRTMSLCGL